MKKIFYIGMLLGLLTACQENERDDFGSTGAIYFQTNPSDWNNTTDSILYSFAGKAVEEKTLHLQVNLMGEATDHDRKIRLVADQEKTTAEAGVHYQALSDFYILPAGAYSVQIPVTLLRGDTHLKKQFFQLTLRLEASEDLQLGLTRRTITRILMADMYMKPTYWDDTWWLGDYSAKKHELFIQRFGDFPETAEDLDNDYARWRAYANTISQYVEDNYPVLDENNQPIEPWFEN